MITGLGRVQQACVILLGMTLCSEFQLPTRGIPETVCGAGLLKPHSQDDSPQNQMTVLSRMTA